MDHDQPSPPPTDPDGSLPALEPQVGECVLCFVSRAVDERGCDGTLGWAARFQEVRVPGAIALVPRLTAAGGTCDCAVLERGYRLVRECLERDVHTDELMLPAVRPTCSGVRRTSARHCRNWERRPRGGSGPEGVVPQDRTVGDVFSENLAAWQEYAATPWARIRYATVGDVLQRHAAELGPRVRVLDVGGGDGRDALPLALAGHDVTVLDPSRSWLAEADRRAADAGVRLTAVEAGLDDLPTGEWDLVLCHFVLRYRPDSTQDVAALASRVRPGGLLSLVDVNPAARVLRLLVAGGPTHAAEELHAVGAEVETFATAARKVEVEQVRAEVEAAGLRVVGRHGHRIANDLLTDDRAKHDPAYFAQLLALERELRDRPPFRDIGFAWQVVAQR